MAGQTVVRKVRRRMTDQERARIEKQGRSEAAAGRALREGAGAGALGAGAGVGARAIQGLLRRRQKPIDMRFTTTQPTVKGLEKDWDRLPATPNPRVSLRRKRKPLSRSDSGYRKSKSGHPSGAAVSAQELERILKGVR
jgi:hypothetical protein